MCSPGIALAAASFAVQTGSAIAGASAQNKASEANERAALAAQRMRAREIRTLQNQVKEATATSIFDIHRQARKAQALATVAAGEANVAGASSTELKAELAALEGEAIERERRNLEQQLLSLESDVIEGELITRQRIASVPRASTFGTALRIGGGALDFGIGIADRLGLFIPGTDETPDPEETS